MNKDEHKLQVFPSEEGDEEKSGFEHPLMEERKPHRAATMTSATTAASANKKGSAVMPSFSSSTNGDNVRGNGASTSLASRSGSGRTPTTSTAGDGETSGGAGRISTAIGGDAGSAAMSALESVGRILLQGVERTATSAAARGVRRKGRTLVARGGAGAWRKKTDRKPRWQSRTTASAISPASLGTKDDIQEMVDTIKSRNPNNGGGRQAKGGPWIPEEDETLRGIVKRDEVGKWKEKAEKLNKAMASRYKAMTDTAVAKGEAPVQYGRVAAQCLHRWKKVLQPGLNKGHWTAKEDIVVRCEAAKAEAAGTTLKWSEVARLLPGRLGKQCRERWFNHLDPSVKKTEWTPREDEILFNAQEFFGTRWCEISKFLPGRTENAVKNRYNSSARHKWRDSRLLAGCGAATKKAASGAFLDRLRTTLKKAPVGRGDGGETPGPSNHKRTLDQEPPAPSSRYAAANSPSSPSPSHKPTKKPKLALGAAPSRKQTKLKQKHLGVTLARAALKTFKTKRAANAKLGGDGGGGVTPTDEKTPATSRASGPPAAMLGSGGNQPQQQQQQQQQQPRTQKQKQKRRNSGTGASHLGTPTSCFSDVIQGSCGGGAVGESGSTARQKPTNTATVQRGKAPTSGTVTSNKRKKSTVQPGGKARGEMVPNGPGAGALPLAQGGVKRKGSGRAADELVGISGRDSSAVVGGGNGNSGRCRPTLRHGNRVVMPGFSLSSWGRSDERSANTAGPGAASKAAHTEEGENNERTSAARKQHTSAAAAAAANRAEAAERYMRGQWTVPQPEAPLAPSLSNSTPIAQHHRYLEFGTSDSRSKCSFSSVARTAEISSTDSVSAASMRRKSGGGGSSSSSSSSSSLSHVGTTNMTNVSPRNRGLATTAETGGAGAGAGVVGIPVALRTPATLSALSTSGTINSNGWLRSPAPLRPLVNINTAPNYGRNSNNINSTNSISITSSSSNNSSSNHIRDAASFVEAFFADEVHPSPLPFAPPEAWRMNSSVNLGQASRTSSAASMMMMMMFGVGVGAGVSTRFDADEPPLPGCGGGGACDGRDLAATVAAATTAILRSQRSIGSSGGSSSADVGGSGSHSLAPAPTSHTTGEPAQSAQGRAGNPTLIDHRQHGNTPEQQVPAQENTGGASSGEHLVRRMAPPPAPCTSFPLASSPSPVAGEMVSSCTVSHSRTPAVPPVAPPHTWRGATGSSMPLAKTPSTIIGGGSGMGGVASHGTVVPQDGGGDSCSGTGGSGSTTHRAGLLLQHEQSRHRLSGVVVPQTGDSCSGTGGSGSTTHRAGLLLQHEQSRHRLSGVVVPQTGAISGGCDLRGFSGVSSTALSSSTGSIVEDHKKNAAHRISGGGGGGGGGSSSACDQVHEADTGVVYPADKIRGGESSAVSTNDSAIAVSGDGNKKKNNNNDNNNNNNNSGCGDGGGDGNAITIPPVSASSTRTICLVPPATPLVPPRS